MWNIYLLWSLLALKMKPAEPQCMFNREPDIEMYNDFSWKGPGTISFYLLLTEGITSKLDQVAQDPVQSNLL